MRIFLGPVEIAGYYSHLQRGLEQRGVEADVITGFPHPFGYGNAKRHPAHVRLWQAVGRALISQQGGSFVRRLMLHALHKLIGLSVFLWALPRYDVFVFGFATTFTDTSAELWLLRRLGRRLVFVFHGSDARPPYIDGARIDPHRPDLRRLRWSAAVQKRRIARIERHAYRIVSALPFAHYQSRPFLDFLAIGMPVALKSAPIAPRTRDSQDIRVVHSPSSPHSKGTALIVAAIEELRREGVPIVLTTLQNLPNSRVLEELERCDFVVDQVYSDTPMAGFATEAAHFGKPAVVGGYFAGRLKATMREEDIPPSLYVEPGELKNAIRTLCQDAVLRESLGQQARAFVQSRWRPEQVADRLLQALRGEVPESWWRDPATLDYLHGYGQHEVQVKTLVRALVGRYGAAALQLQDKPALESLFLSFAEALPQPAKTCSARP